MTREEVQTPPGRAGQTTVARTDDPSGQSEQTEQLDRLSGAMEKLDARERLAIHIYYLEADPVRAASSALGLSRSGYYKLLARARDRLAGLLGKGSES